MSAAVPATTYAAPATYAPTTDAEDELMTVGMTLMNFGHEDATLARDTQLIMKWSQGDFSDL